MFDGLFSTDPPLQTVRFLPIKDSSVFANQAVGVSIGIWPG